MKREREARNRRIIAAIVTILLIVVGVVWPLTRGLEPAEVAVRAVLAFGIGVVVWHLPRGWVQTVAGIAAMLGFVVIQPDRGAVAFVRYAASLLPFIAGVCAVPVFFASAARRATRVRPAPAGFHVETRGDARLEVCDIGGGRRIVLFTTPAPEGTPHTRIAIGDDRRATPVDARLGSSTFTYPANLVVTPAAAERALSTFRADGLPDPHLTWTPPEPRDEALVPPPLLED